MHALIKDGVVEKYPYTFGKLRKDNPNTSFPPVPPNELLAEWNVYPVARVEAPKVDPLTHDVKEATPEFVDGQWRQVWVVTPATPEEVASRKAEKNSSIKQQRAEEYKAYSDQFFFKWQRGEGTEQEWLDAVQHVKELLPYVD